MKAVKIVIIGAGSASFGLSSLATLLREPTLRGSTLSLVDTNAHGLEVVHQLAARMNREWDAGVYIERNTDRRAVLDGADFVVCAIEVGPREELWRQDWQVTLRHGLRQPYAENGGPGGFMHAARNIPPILDIARDMERLCPQALLVNLSNPLPRLCRVVAKYTSIDVVGLCHGIGHAYRKAGVMLADQLGIDIPPAMLASEAKHDEASQNATAQFDAHITDVIDIKAAGLNHFTWVLDIRDRRTGDDLYPALRERFLGASPGQYEPLTREMLRLTGYLPVTADSHICEYLPYTYNATTKPWEKFHLPLYDWAGAAQRRDEMWQYIEHLVAEGAPALEQLRQAHSEGVYEVVHGVAHDTNLYYLAVNVPNNGAISDLPAETIVEVPGLITGMGVLPLRMGTLPPVVGELCRREAALVEVAVDAAVQGSRELALHALALDPMVNDLDLTGAVLDDYLETHKQHLPQFYKQWTLSR